MYRVELKDLGLLVFGILAVFSTFLMYRVELKAIHGMHTSFPAIVPNVPCGVESHPITIGAASFQGFLMYRVELKVCCVDYVLKFLHFRS